VPISLKNILPYTASEPIVSLNPQKNIRNSQEDDFCEDGNDIIAIAMYE
jgi:hypothetical protein